MKANDLCKSEDAIFAAAGVCDGYLDGVKDVDGRKLVHSEIIDVATKTVRDMNNLLIQDTEQISTAYLLNTDYIKTNQFSLALICISSLG